MFVPSCSLCRGWDPTGAPSFCSRPRARFALTCPRCESSSIGAGAGLEKLQQESQALGLGDHARFLGALYDEEQLAPWFKVAGAFCVPAMLGLPLLHAFGYGLPVVTGDNTQVHGPEIEALRHGENGLLYLDGSVAALAAALRRILENETLRRDMSAAALRTVEERYTIDRMVEGMEAAVRFCAANGTRPGT